MLLKWSEVTGSEGSAAHTTASLAQALKVVDGFVLSATAMPECFEERQEQLNSLLKVRNGENNERVASELKRTIITVHVPREVQKAVDDAEEILKAPVIMRLSNIGKIANPLEHFVIIGVAEGKPLLDGIRMLYAEMYNANNLALEDDNKSASVIIQKQPQVENTYRIIKKGNTTIVEGARGLGAWVGFGEPDRFLFENSSFARAENGDGKGVRWSEQEKWIEDFTRTPLGGEDAQKILEFAAPYLEKTSQPLLCYSNKDGFGVLGAGPSLD